MNIVKKEISEIKNEMIKEALELYKEIHPPLTVNAIEDCFTYEKNRIILWFNISNLSTKVVQRDLSS